MKKLVKCALALVMAVCGYQALAGTASLEVECVPSGVGTVEGESKWKSGSQNVTLTAKASTWEYTYQFSYWSTKADGSDKVSENAEYSATYKTGGTGKTNTYKLYAIYVPVTPEPTGSLKSVAATGGTLSGTTLSVGDGSQLVYENGAWYASLTFTWKNSTTAYTLNDYGYAVFTSADAARFTIDETTYTGSDAVSGVSTDSWALTGATQSGSYKYAIGDTRSYTYLNTATWRVKLTPELLQQQGAFSLTMNVGALVWGNGEKGNPDGVAYTDYTIDVPSTVKLKDEYGNQVYPAVDYKAQVEDTHKKYETLGAALKAATAGQTVNALSACEQAAFEVGANVTLNLAGYGHADATYKFVGVTDLTMDAKVVSSKAETVTTDATGFAVKNENNTYTIYRAHIHAWEFVLNGATLTANCTNTTSECDVETTSITLTVTGGSDGVAPTFAIDNQEAFLASVNKFNPSLVTIGEIKTVRTTDDGAATDKWYVGNYESTCDVTIEGEGVKTLVKEFSITKPQGGYEKNGWVVGSSDIRYDDNDSTTAIAAAADGDTIYYRGNDRDFETHEFSVGDKDLTIDFGGKTLTYTGGAKNMTLKNTGSGTLTFQNVLIKQPQYTVPVVGTKISSHINADGNIAFGTGVVVQNTASSSDNQCKITSTSGKLSVLDGGYQCKFLVDGGAVEISGGVYTYNDHCKPSADMLKASYIVREVTVEQTTVYQVVYHEHHAAYSAEDNVISATCDAQDHEYCGYGTKTATLNAPDKTDDGQPYDLATIDYSTGFPEQTGVITYWNGETAIDPPSTFGSYTAKTTIGGATAAKGFTVSHVHHFEYDADQTAGTITARCTVSENCPFNVDKRIATLTAQNGTYTGAGQDLAATSTNTGDFPTNVVLTYSCEDKPTAAGDYTATMTVADDTSVTKDFSIGKAAMGNVAATMTTTSFEYDGTVRENSLGSATLGSYGLTSDDYDLSGITSATGSGYSNETYTVTLTGKGNFEGTQTATWTITAPTVEFAENPLTAAIIEGGSTAYATCEGKTLTVTDSTLLPYQNGWYAGFIIDYPKTVDTWAANSQVTDPANLRFRNSTMDEGVYYTGTQIDAGESALTAISKDSHSWSAAAGTVTYVKNLTWWAPVITPALVEQAALDGQTELSYTATLGGLKWSSSGSLSTTTFEGVRFADFAIKVPLAGFVFALPANAAYDIGDTVLSTAKIRLGAGASVTTTAQQAEGQVYTEVTGYQVYETEDAGTYTYSCDVATHYVKVPDVAHATKVVSVDGTKIVGVDNVYAVHYGDTVTIVYTPDTGYETADGTKTIEGVTGDTMLTDLPTVTAISYAITYELDGGVNAEANPTNYTIESETITLADPTKQDYNFTGWTPEGVIAKGSTGDKSFTANWKLATVEFTVKAPDNASVTKVATNGVEMVVPYTVLPGTAVTVSYKANEGYLFANGANTMDAEITVNQGGEQPAPTGTETTKGEAKIGTQYYLTLKAAFGAVEAGEASGTVELLADATIDDAFGFGKDVKVDLNGKQFTANGAIAVTNGATVALVNSKSTAPSKTGSEGGFAPNDVITVEGGATIDLSALPFGTTYGGIQGTGSLTLASGSESKFYKWDVASVDSANWMFANYPAFFTGSVIPVGAKVTIGDKTWTGTVNGFEVPGTVAFAQIDATGNLGGVEFPIVVNECYTSLADAVAAVKNNGMVKLVADTTTTAWIRFNENYNVTLDMNGKTISSASDECLVMGLASASALGTGMLTITGDGSIIQTYTGTDADVVWARHGNVVISNGYFEVNGTYQCVYSTNRAKIDIYGGTFKNLTGGDVLNVNNAGATTDIQCYGGSYSKDPSLGDDAMGGTFVAEGYASYKDSEMFTVAKLPAVTVTDITPPADLEAAFQYATTDTESAFTGGWKVDFYVSFDAAVAAGAVTLKGQYGEYPWTGAALPAMAANEELPLMQTAGNEVSVEMLLAMQTFNCGVTNISAKGGTEMKVVLKMYKGDETFVLNTKTYKLVGKGPQTADVGGGAVIPTEEEGVYEVSPDPTTGNVNVIPETVSETDVFVVTITNDMTITGVPADQIEIMINDVDEPIPHSVFVGGDETGFSTELNPDGSAEVGAETISVTPVLSDAEDEVKPLVIDETNVSVGVKTIPGLNYSLLIGDTVTKIETVVKTVLATEARMALEAAKTDDPAKFYKVQVAK